MDLKCFVSIVLLLKNQNRISMNCSMCINHKSGSSTLSKLFHFLSDCNQNVIHTCMTPAQEKMIVMGKSIESFINVYDILSFWK